MLWTICMALVVLWLIGMVTAYTMGCLVQDLPGIAYVLIKIRADKRRADKSPSREIDPIRFTKKEKYDEIMNIEYKTK